MFSSASCACATGGHRSICVDPRRRRSICFHPRAYAPGDFFLCFTWRHLPPLLLEVAAPGGRLPPATAVGSARKEQLATTASASSPYPASSPRPQAHLQIRAATPDRAASEPPARIRRHAQAGAWPGFHHRAPFPPELVCSGSIWTIAPSPEATARAHPEGSGSPGRLYSGAASVPPLLVSMCCCLIGSREPEGDDWIKRTEGGSIGFL